MAISVTHIQGEASTANTQSTVHATSFLPVAGRTYLLILRATAGSSLSGATPTATHGGTGLTLTLVAGTQVHSQAGVVASGCKLCSFVGTAAGSCTTGVFTTDTGTPAGAGVDGQQYELIEITGNDTSTPIPQDDILQENNTTDGTLTVSLAGAFVDANSYTLSAASVSNGNTDPVIPTGWASLSSRVNTLPAGRLTVAYENGNDASADWTGYSTAGTEDLAAFVIEIAAGAVSGAIAGTTAGVATVTGTLTGTGTLAGTSAGVATVSGTLVDVVGQTAVPDATISSGDWLNELASATDLHLSVDEYPTPNDSDYIESGLTPSTVRLRLSDILPPEFTP